MHRRGVAVPAGGEQRAEPGRPAVRRSLGRAGVEDAESAVGQQPEVARVRVAVQPAGGAAGTSGAGGGQWTARSCPAQ